MQTFRKHKQICFINYSFTYGGVAQLGEHLPCKQGVRSSILLISTMVNIGLPLNIDN